MDANFWHKCWQRNTIGFHQVEFHPWLEQLILPELLTSNDTANAIDSDDACKRVFVPLSGKSDDMLWFANYGEVVGAELSRIACRDFFKEQGLDIQAQVHDEFNVYQHENISLWQGDFFNLTCEDVGDFHWIYDRAALVALPEEMQQRYVKHLQTFIKPITKLFLLTVEFPANEMSGPPFSINETAVKALFNNYNVNCLAVKAIPDKRFAQRVFNVSQFVEKLYVITHH
ncbi:hypothetical protein [Thalassotalea sediminis]|uniref:hypothetical protein n=1 Tax=Thalassotalea sediminis TaxID=1759089 RepID=UPI002572728B|nr:hypothetical protein [Thalassotalea sediminis]